MNSWEIIRKEFTKSAVKGTVGYDIQLNHAADMIVAIENNLSDKEEAMASFNKDGDVTVALLHRSFIEQLRKGEVIK